MTTPATNGLPVELHPSIAAMLRQAAAAGRKAPWQCSVAEARAMLAASPAALGPGPHIGEVSDISIPAPQGAIPARLYRPAGASGIALYLHGGGWVLGELDDFDCLARHIAVAAGATLVMPRYRLAPEHPFPAGLDDARAALRWVMQAPEGLGRQPVVLIGDSAGGNLAAIVAIEQATPAIVGQALAYPLCDGAMDTASYAAYGAGLPLARADVAWFLEHYLAGNAGMRLDPHVSPLRRVDLGRSPRSLVLTAEYDVLRDEGEAFAHALAAAGVDATHETMPGVTHGVLRLCNHVSTARDAIARIGAFARERIAAGILA
jgi:acetyl esterase